MKTSLFIVFVVLLATVGLAQTTVGHKSPIVIGVKGKVNYINTQVIKQKVPAELTPYLAGLLFSNKVKSDTRSLNAALNVWFKKYAELKVAIQKVPDATIRGSAFLRLSEGDFAGVENFLKIKTNYNNLVNTFPKSYITNGNQSPIIIGDYGTVTYVVKEVIEYQLPEGLTLNLLNELRSKSVVIGNQNSQLGDMRNTIQSRDAVIKDYIGRYNVIKEELKKSPSAIYKKAYQFFKDGDLSQAFKALNETPSNDQIYAQSNLLKAKILLLEFSSKAQDNTIAEIDKAYSIGVQIRPSAENYFEYGRFLVDYLKNYTAAVTVLEKADLLNTNLSQKIKILNYLGISYAAIDRVKANETLRKALTIMDSLEPLKDRNMIVLKSLLLSNISADYSARFFNINTVRTAINYSQQAIDEIKKLPALTEEDQCRLALYFNQQGQQFAMIAEIAQADQCYQKALDFFEKAANDKPNVYTIALATVYYNQASTYSNNGQVTQSIDLLKKALSLTDAKIDANRRIYFFTSEQLYTALLKNLITLNRYPEVLQYLYKLKENLQPLLVSDPKTFQIHETWIYTDLGNLYLNMGKIDSAAKYLKPAYDYYISNLNAAQYDKQKFSICLFQMNELFVQSNRMGEAIENNRRLLATFKNSVLINKFAYDDFIPQVERQIARVYSAAQQKDSAYYHMQSALTFMEAKAKQYGTTYLSTYNEYAIHSFLLNLKFKDYNQANSAVDKFINTCNAILEIDPFVKDHMQSAVGESIANFAVSLFAFTQDPTSGIAGEVDSLKLFENVERYFKASEKFFKNGLALNPKDGFKYAMALTNAIYLQSFWSQQLKDQSKIELHRKKKCEIAKDALATLAKLPINEVTSGIANRVQFLTTDCH